MKKIIIILILFFVSCGPTQWEKNEMQHQQQTQAKELPIKKYKFVIGVSPKIFTYQVTTNRQRGGNSIQRGAGGAILGGGADILLGGSGKGGAILGGLVGAATTDNAEIESYTEIKTEIIYTIYFNDSTIEIQKNNCYLTIGDSVAVR